MPPRSVASIPDPGAPGVPVAGERDPATLAAIRRRRRLTPAEAVLVIDGVLAEVAAGPPASAAGVRPGDDVRAAARLGLDLLGGAGRGLGAVRRPLDAALASPDPDAGAVRAALDAAARASLGAGWRERAATAAPSRRRRWRRVAVVAAVVAVIAAGGAAAGMILLGGHAPTTRGAVTSASAPLSVGGDASVAVNPARGGCDTTFVFVGRGSLSGSGSLVYRWEQSDGTTSGDTSLSITPQEGAFQLTQAWRLQGSRTVDGTETLHILRPVDRRVSQPFHYACP